MSGIQRNLLADPRISLIDRHLPNTQQVQRLLKKEGRAHIFNDRETLKSVTQAVIERGQRTGENDKDDAYERYGLYFVDLIGYIIRVSGESTPLHYGELKIIKATGEYHAIPRTGPRRAS